MWVLDYLPDVESDMSVFHRVDDIYTLPAPLFFQRAERLPAYDGIMKLRAMKQEYERMESEQGSEGQGHAGADFGGGVSKSGAPVQTVPAAAAKIHKGFQGDDRNPPVFGPRPSR